ncbi:MAG: hypothetical protein PHC85_01430 [Candidatus Pacebacteria bacterium]|nr:hypothetical protein [Candidatus Paceibacterota bacterium]
MKLKTLKKKDIEFLAGFTIIETLVSLAIFSAFVLSITAVSISVVKTQRKVFLVQNLYETGRYTLEFLTRELRTSVVNSVSEDGSTLDITNSAGENLVYKFGDVGLYFYKPPSTVPVFDVTPEGAVKVSGAFYVRDYTSPDRTFVTIILKLEPGVRSSGGSDVINLQSSVALR